VIVPWSGPGWVMPGLVKRVTMARPERAECEFKREFQVDEGAVQPIRVEFDSVGECTLSVDGREMAGPVRGEQSVEMPRLATGAHLMVFHLVREKGVPALRCRVVDAASQVIAETGQPAWTYKINGSAEVVPVPVAEPWIADDADPLNMGPDAVWGFPVGTAVVAVVGLAGLAWGFGAARGRKRSGAGEQGSGRGNLTGKEHPHPGPLPDGEGDGGMDDRGYWLLVAGVMAVWAGLLLWAWRHIGGEQGFDVGGHLEYIDHVRKHWTVPLATQGWQMYQAPLYYFLAAIVLKVTGAPVEMTECVPWLRGLNLVLAMGFLAAAAGALKGFSGGRNGRAAVGFMLLASCPVAFYLFCYVSNENLSTVMVAVVFLVLSRMRTGRMDKPRWACALGVSVGLALLSKVSGLLLLAPIGCFYAVKLLAERRTGKEHPHPTPPPEGEGAGRGALVCVVSGAVVSGWYFGYVWWHLGSPIVGNWDAASGQAWWQVPGVRSMSDYMPSLSPVAAPLFAGFHDVWSGFWSTMAGDALASGTTRVEVRPGWNDWVFPVTLAGVAALIGLGLAGWGIPRALRGRWRAKDMALTSGAGAGVFAMVLMTLVVPSYAQAKSFYAMIVILPMCYFAARALTSRAREDALGVRQAAGLALPWALAFVVMFAMVPSGQARSGEALRAAYGLKEEEGVVIEKLSRALESDPENWALRVALAKLVVRHPEGQARAAELIDAAGVDRTLSESGDAPAAGWPGRLYVRAQLLANENRSQDAIRMMLMAAQAGPSMSEAWGAAVLWLNHSGNAEAAREVARQGLVFHPWAPDLRAAAR
jgi:hypothetical protein